MSNYWTPSGPAINATATVAGQQVITASLQVEGLIRFLNKDTTVGFCAMVSASATTGEAANATPVYPGSVFWISATSRTPFAYVSGASIYAQAGYGPVN
jgi:hypothetical protein